MTSWELGTTLEQVRNEKRRPREIEAAFVSGAERSGRSHRDRIAKTEASTTNPAETSRGSQHARQHAQKARANCRHIFAELISVRGGDRCNKASNECPVSPAESAAAEVQDQDGD